MEFQASQHTIDKLIYWIRSGRLALPDFQREFVWNPSKVVELLDSVARQWPIGSLLLLGGPQEFGTREIEGAPPLIGRSLDMYVLDGQQRLTSLFHAISDVSDYCYYVDFSEAARDSDEYLQWEKRHVFSRKYPEVETRAKLGVALVKEIWELSTFYEWIENVRDTDKQRLYVDIRERRLRGLQSQVYKVMAIQLDQDIQIEALARIFETLNRTGIRLNAFDLMVALLYPAGFNLRERWDEARSVHPVFDRFDIDPFEVLKLIALLIRYKKGKSLAKGVRQGDLLNIKRDLIIEFWNEAISLYSESLSYAANRFGCTCSATVPAWSMYLGIAAWLVRDHFSERSLSRWYWSSSFAQSYSQAANTISVADFDIITVGDGDRLSDNRARVPFSVLDEPARKNGLAMRALACFLIARGALDPISGERLAHSNSVGFRAIFGDDLRKISTTDSFDRVVIVAADTDRVVGTTGASALSRIPSEALAERLETQLIDASNRLRNIDRLKDEISAAAR